MIMSAVPLLLPFVVVSQPQQHNTHHEWAPAAVTQFDRLTKCEIPVEAGPTRREVVETTVLEPIAHSVYVRLVSSLSFRSNGIEIDTRDLFDALSIH